MGEEGETGVVSLWREVLRRKRDVMMQRQEGILSMVRHSHMRLMVYSERGRKLLAFNAVRHSIPMRDADLLTAIEVGSAIAGTFHKISEPSCFF